MKPSGQAS